MKKTQQNRRQSQSPRQLSGDERIVYRTNQRHKKNKRKKTVIYSLLCFIFLCVGIIAALTVFFDINSITVSGDSNYSAEEIIRTGEIIQGDNLIFVSEKKANELITEKLPYIGSVSFKKKLPSELQIIVTKTRAVYAVPQDGCYMLLNENGKVLETGVEYIGENLILLNAGEITSAETGKIITLANEKALEKLKTVTDACEKCGLQDITAADLSNIYNIKLEYQGRITLELGETDSGNLLRKLDLGRAAIETQDKENPLYRGIINLTVAGQGAWLEETVTSETEPTEASVGEQNNDESTQTTVGSEEGSSKST